MPAKTTKAKAAKKPAAKTPAKTSSAKQEAVEIVKVKGEELLRTVKGLIKEGNVRQISILDKAGKPIVIIPLTLGVVGAILAPSFAAIGAVAALVTKCTVKVERTNHKAKA
jgi:hypothetical protein